MGTVTRPIVLSVVSKILASHSLPTLAAPFTPSHILQFAISHNMPRETRIMLECGRQLSLVKTVSVAGCSRAVLGIVVDHIADTCRGDWAFVERVCSELVSDGRADDALVLIQTCAYQYPDNGMMIEHFIESGCLDAVVNSADPLVVAMSRICPQKV